MVKTDSSEGNHRHKITKYRETEAWRTNLCRQVKDADAESQRGKPAETASLEEKLWVLIIN